MSKLANCFRKRNRYQRISSVFTLALLMFLLGLHNPFMGYDTIICSSPMEVLGYVPDVECRQADVLKFSSNGAFFEWIMRLDSFLSLCIPVLLFGIISHVLLCSEEE